MSPMYGGPSFQWGAQCLELLLEEMNTINVGLICDHYALRGKDKTPCDFSVVRGVRGESWDAPMICVISLSFSTCDGCCDLIGHVLCGK